MCKLNWKQVIKARETKLTHNNLVVERFRRTTDTRDIIGLISRQFNNAVSISEFYFVEWYEKMFT